MYPSPNHRAIGWALLSQSIWLPLLVIDASDRWQARVSALTPPTDPSRAPIPSRPPIPTTRLAALSPLPILQQQALSDRQILKGSTGNQTGLLLNPAAAGLHLPEPPAILRNLQQAVAAPLQRSVAAPLQSVLAMARPSNWLPPVSASFEPVRSRPLAPAPGTPRWQGPPIPTADTDILRRTFTRSELLGGTLSLRDIDDGPMSAVALAERARWASSSDPMAALPPTWRDPMRQAIGKLPGSGSRMERARVVHVPSRRVRHTTEIPLALQSDGSVDILSQPDNPGIVTDIQEWSSRQQPPVQGGVQPAVVMLHPVSESAALGGTIEGIPLPLASESHNGIPLPILSESAAGPRTMEASPSRLSSSQAADRPAARASSQRELSLPPIPSRASAAARAESAATGIPSSPQPSISPAATTRAAQPEPHQSAEPSWESVAPAEAIPFQAAATPAAEPAPAPEPVATSAAPAPGAATVASAPQPAAVPASAPVAAQ